jgi:hypothetical protein
MISIDQKTELGQLGLKALAKNFCGPSYDLSDLKVNFTKIGDVVYVQFYDMESSVNSGNEDYGRINFLLTKEQAN